MLFEEKEHVGFEMRLIHRTLWFVGVVALVISFGGMVGSSMLRSSFDIAVARYLEQAASLTVLEQEASVLEDGMLCTTTTESFMAATDSILQQLKQLSTMASFGLTVELVRPFSNIDTATYYADMGLLSESNYEALAPLYEQLSGSIGTKECVPLMEEASPKNETSV